jgi:hypothetical protein
VKTLRPIIISLCVIFVMALSAWWYSSADKKGGKVFDESEPDLPPASVKIDKAEYKRLRNEQIAMWRGLETFKPGARTKAVRDMERGERERDARRAARGERPSGVQRWHFVGPAPIPVNAATSYSGRVVALAVHPTNPDIVYAGAAQGGLYRSLNAGGSWTPLLDTALTLSIGSIGISPSDPSTVYVGTGETSFSADSFFGVGVYRITNADTNPVVSGPFNRTSGGADVFTGRGISEIVVDPTDPNRMIVATAQGVAGIGGNATGATLPNAGIYRTLNALSANPVFEKLNIQGAGSVNRSIADAAGDPADPNRLLVSVIGANGDGGVYLTTDAYNAVPTFTRTLATGNGNSLGRTEFAVHRTGDVLTVYAAAGTANGTVYRSNDGGATFVPLSGGAGFCNPQCFYDIAVAVDPTDVNKVYLGGFARARLRAIDKRRDGFRKQFNEPSRGHARLRYRTVESGPCIFRERRRGLEDRRRQRHTHCLDDAQQQLVQCDAVPGHFASPDRPQLHSRGNAGQRYSIPGAERHNVGPFYRR